MSGRDQPAFPSVCLGDPGHPASSPGMSLRDWFAGQALSEAYRQVSAEWDNKLITKPYGATAANWIPLHIAGAAYQIADAMLAARSPKP